MAKEVFEESKSVAQMFYIDTVTQDGGRVTLNGPLKNHTGN